MNMNSLIAESKQYNNNELKDILLVSLLEHYCTNNNITNVDDIVQKLEDTKIIKKTNSDNATLKTKMLSIIDTLGNSTGLTIDYSVSRFKREFDNIEFINNGGFGTVYEARHILDDKTYAIKKVSLDKLDQYVLREIKHLAKLNHRNVVRYYSSWYDYDYKDDNSSYSDDDSINKSQQIKTMTLYIQMELYDKTLSDYLFERQIVDLNKNNSIFSQIVEGLKYIHGNEIVHRDLKPANIFMKDDVVVIGDFGLSKNVSSIYTTELIAYDPSDVTKYIGTKMYASPEQLSGKQYSFETDIYSLGIIRFEMYTFYKTGFERVQLLQSLRDGLAECDDIIKKMTDVNPNRRPTVNEL